MAAAGDIVIEFPAVEGNPVEEFQDSVPHVKDMQASPLESTDLTKSHTRKYGCSRVTLALIAGAFVFAAAAATAAVVGTSLLNTAGSDSSAADGGVTGGSGSGSPYGGVSGSFVLRAENVETLAGDDRFSLALATAVASTLALQTGGTITAGDVQVSVATRRLGATPSLRAHARRLEEDYIFIDYIVVLHGKGAPDPEAATQALLAADPAAMTAQIEAEMTSQGLEQDLALEVISISADVATSEDEVVDWSQAQEDPDANAGPFNGSRHASPKKDRCYKHFGGNKQKCDRAGRLCIWSHSKCITPTEPESSAQDSCYDRCGSNKTKCLEAGETCQWFENDGDSKCIEKRGHHRECDENSEGDECYEHFGSNKDQCLEAGENCQWFEDDGEGKCIEKRGHHGEGDEDGEGDECHEHFGSNKDECLEAGANCQWVEDDGDGKCVEKWGHHGGKSPKERCAKFGSQECSGTDGLCEWKADANSTNGTCVPTFAYLDTAEVQEAACELKNESECTEASVCGWSGGTCRFSNFTDVCKDLFGTDADRCLQQEWLCMWTQMPAGEEAACTMKLPRGGGPGSHGPGGRGLGGNGGDKKGSGREQGSGCQRRRRRRPGQGGHSGGGHDGRSSR